MERKLYNMAQGYNQQQYLYIPSPVLICKAASNTVATDVQGMSAGIFYAHYMGRSYMDATGINVLGRIVATGTNTTWHQVGVFQGPSNFPLGPSASPFTLTALGSTSVNTYTSAGVKNTRIPATIPLGTDLWLVFGASANSQTSGPTWRSMTADSIMSGMFQMIPGSGQLITITSLTGPAVASTAYKPFWIAGYLGDG